MYTVLTYGQMATDRVRMDAYARAIARYVKPGSVVLDIGAGTGILSLLAAKAGAKKVYAVETNPAIQLLPELAAENGFASQIEIRQESSLEVVLPERADVIVSDLRGSFPLNEAHAAVLRDARQRLLAPGGTMIPTRDRFFVALVEARGMDRMLDSSVDGFRRYGFTADAVLRSLANTAYNDAACPVLASDLLTNAVSWADATYGSFAGVAEGEVELVAQRGGTPTGLAIWFEAELTGDDDLRYETNPGMSMAYARTYLPLGEPVTLDAGAKVRATIRVDERGARWAWETRWPPAEGSAPKTLRQSTFLGTPTSPAALLRASTSFMPARSASGDRALAALGAMDGTKTVAGIADALSSDGSRSVVLDEVRTLVERYGR